MTAEISKESVNSGNTQAIQACPYIGSENIAVVEAKGLKKSIILAKALKSGKSIDE